MVTKNNAYEIKNNGYFKNSVFKTEVLKIINEVRCALRYKSNNAWDSRHFIKTRIFMTYF